MTVHVTFDLLAAFPVTTRGPTSIERALAEHGHPLPPQITYENHKLLLAAVIEEEGCGAANSAVESALKQSHIYKAWQSAMPKLKNVPAIHGFRNKNKHLNNLDLVNSEILSNGGLLQEGQLLYRGGQFGACEIHIVDGPISTSVMPSVARWHAVEVHGHLAVLRIARGGAVRGFAYSSTGNQRHKREFEVVLQNHLTLRRTDSYEVGDLPVFEYDVYASVA